MKFKCTILTAMIVLLGILLQMLRLDEQERQQSLKDFKINVYNGCMVDIYQLDKNHQVVCGYPCDTEHYIGLHSDIVALNSYGFKTVVERR